eukprot:scaffold34184_cov57-Phaeocystis_antarctica.AAC.1
MQEHEEDMLRVAATAVANATDGAQQPGPAAGGGEPSSEPAPKRSRRARPFWHTYTATHGARNCYANITRGESSFSQASALRARAGRPASAQWPPHPMGKKGGKAPALATEPEELKHLGAPRPLASSAHAATASRIASRPFLASVPIRTSPSAQRAHGAASSSPSCLPLLPPPLP